MSAYEQTFISRRGMYLSSRGHEHKVVTNTGGKDRSTYCVFSFTLNVSYAISSGGYDSQNIGAILFAHLTEVLLQDCKLLPIVNS